MEEKQTVEILLAEDSPSDALLVQECFRESPIPNRVHVVADGEDALDFLKREACFEHAPRPDLILLDLNIPKVHGLTVLATVKADPDLQQIPVIVLTASAIEEDVHRAYHLQANSYLSKPTDLIELKAMIESIERHWLTHVRLPSTPSQDSAALDANA